MMTIEDIHIRYENLDSKTQNTIKDEYISYLKEMGYAKISAENTDDGRDEYLLDVYNNL